MQNVGTAEKRTVVGNWHWLQESEKTTVNLRMTELAVPLATYSGCVSLHVFLLVPSVLLTSIWDCLEFCDELTFYAKSGSFQKVAEWHIPSIYQVFPFLFWKVFRIPKSLLQSMKAEGGAKSRRQRILENAFLDGLWDLFGSHRSYSSFIHLLLP